MTETVELHVDDESVEIEIDSMSDLEKLTWMSKYPDNIGENGTDAQMVPYLVELTVEQTELTYDLIKELPMDELGKLFKRVVEVSFDVDANDASSLHEYTDSNDGDVRGFQ